ncbi:MAG: hypothetical protein DID89_2727547547 [Candidatus Nitrotoga sp. CP45]|nr:MAG: hypothetical protein DID89_2727547547 [Candidatus Nitrotoga sp. CP45]
MQVNKYKFYEQFKLGDSRINRAESISWSTFRLTEISNQLGFRLSSSL